MNGTTGSEHYAALDVEFGEDFETLRLEWDRLALVADSVFATWEWASIWWRHHGEGRPLYLTTCRDPDGTLIAIVPLYLASQRPLRVVRLVGHGPGDELGPICDPRDRPRVSATMREALGRLPGGWDVFVAENLPSDPAWKEFGRARGLDVIPNPVIELQGTTWEDYLASRSSKFRQQVRRNERRLKGDHGLCYRYCNDPGQLSADLDVLFALHERRWGVESSGVFFGREGAFQREFAAAALERDWLRLWLLELEGEPVAARLGFSFAGADSGYQSGRTRDWEKYGIGLVLQAHVIREAISAGTREYRLLRGGESYKGRLTDVDRGLESIAVPHGMRGGLALAGQRATAALPDRLRGFFTRLGGGR